MDNNLTNEDVNNIVNFDPNTPVVSTTTGTTSLMTNGTGALSNTTATINNGWWSYSPYYQSGVYFTQPTIRQAVNGFVIDYNSSVYIAKNLKEVTKILGEIFNPSSLKKGKKRG